MYFVLGRGRVIYLGFGRQFPPWYAVYNQTMHISNFIANLHKKMYSMFRSTGLRALEICNLHVFTSQCVTHIEWLLGTRTHPRCQRNLIKALPSWKMSTCGENCPVVEKWESCSKSKRRPNSSWKQCRTARKVDDECGSWISPRNLPNTTCHSEAYVPLRLLLYCI